MEKEIINFNYELEKSPLYNKYKVLMIVEYKDKTTESIGEILFDDKQLALEYINNKIHELEELRETNSSFND